MSARHVFFYCAVCHGSFTACEGDPLAEMVATTYDPAEHLERLRIGLRSIGKDVDEEGPWKAAVAMMKRKIAVGEMGTQYGFCCPSCRVLER